MIKPSKLQAALQSGVETIDSLTQKYGIAAKRHPKYPELVMLKYDMVDSPMSVPLVQECRGVIVNVGEDFKFVARPFDKFFNLGEGHAAKIDWSTARVQEKLDGSLMILYFYDGQWQVASSGTPDAGGPVANHDLTFTKLFWDTWRRESYSLEDLNVEYTFMFELTTPLNRVVVDHKEPHLTLIGVRHTESGEEESVQGTCLDFRTAKEFPLRNLKEVEASMERFSGAVQEGYVVVDGDWNRVKIKHPSYVAIHHMVGTASPKSILECVRMGETPEILTYFPEWKGEFEQMSISYEGLVKHLEEVWTKIEHIDRQKDFAYEAVRSRCSSALFKRRSKGTSFREYIRDMDIKTLMGILKVES